MEFIVGSLITIAVTVITWWLNEKSQQRSRESEERTRRDEREFSSRGNLIEERTRAFGEFSTQMGVLRRTCVEAHLSRELQEEPPPESALSDAILELKRVGSIAALIRRFDQTETVIRSVETAADRLYVATQKASYGRWLEASLSELERLMDDDVKEPPRQEVVPPADLLAVRDDARTAPGSASGTAGSWESALGEYDKMKDVFISAARADLDVKFGRQVV